MGLTMDSIHAPTASGSSAASTSAANGSEKSLMELIGERDNLEAELTALGEVLVSHAVDMNTPLLTRDGFPRSDLDVPQIRTTRARIIWLRNDYKTLMSKIEAGLHAHHAGLQAGTVNGGSSSSSANNASGSTGAPAQPHAFAGSSLEPPFARVNSVVSGSPAETAGLRAGDEVRKFGSVKWTNHERLAQVAQLVQRSENREIVIKVKRKERDGSSQEEDLTLVPRRNWGGRGMLGCHLVPV